MGTIAQWLRGRAGDVLTTAGAGLGVLGVIAMVIKLKMTITPGMQVVPFHRGLFAASAAFLLIGAWIGRREKAARREAELDAGRQAEQLEEAFAQQRPLDDHQEGDSLPIDRRDRA